MLLKTARRHPAGLSLVELLVGAAIAGLLLLAVAEANVLLQKIFVSQTLISEHRDFRAILGMIVANESKCVDLFNDASGGSWPQAMGDPGVPRVFTLYRVPEGGVWINPYWPPQNRFGKVRVTQVIFKPEIEVPAPDPDLVHVIGDLEFELTSSSGLFVSSTVRDSIPLMFKVNKGPLGWPRIIRSCAGTGSESSKPYSIPVCTLGRLLVMENGVWGCKAVGP